VAQSERLADEPIVRLILDGTVVRVRLDRKATSISLLVVIGVRENGSPVYGFSIHTCSMTARAGSLKVMNPIWCILQICNYSPPAAV
jgi:hypothetical protein